MGQLQLTYCPRQTGREGNSFAFGQFLRASGFAKKGEAATVAIGRIKVAKKSGAGFFNFSYHLKPTEGCAAIHRLKKITEFGDPKTKLESLRKIFSN